MKRSLKVIIGFVLASALAGCETTFYEAGTTPITLSPAVVAGFEKYKQADYPLFFAVSTNGRGYGYFTCPSLYCDADYSGQAISLCERRSGGVDCKIFAFDRGIVWKGPITYPGTRPDNIGVKGDAEPPKPQILTPRPIKEIPRAKGLAEPQVKPTSVDYALLIGRWEGDFVSKTLENHVAWESKLTLDVFTNGRGRFSAAKRNQKWSTIVKIERGVVILRLYRKDVEFVYTQNDDTATLSAAYEDKFKGYPRIRYVTLKKRVAPSQ